ncbi:hypothetical protein KC19_3G039200 [Ceratodon purpureus]|uniref:Uncharacterized protein ycf33 n=1 Tax=Ceratodon purpureus TaxID=3225 RepID=A0A8T0IGW7_CERPU|nr:hypothetical protein KC19_3G039200 [Ceratodon purpureus]
MATLRALPSVSGLLSNQPQKLSSRVGSGRSVSLGSLPIHVKLSRTQALRSAKREIQGCSDEERSVERLEERLERVVGLRNGALESFVRENARELAIGAVVFALVCRPDEPALALGPGGPVMEEFWDNVRRYGFYFFTVVSGGLYSLAKPLLDLLKDPSTQFLVLITVIGTFYLLYLTVSTMLGLNDFQYEYAQ